MRARLTSVCVRLLLSLARAARLRLWPLCAGSKAPAPNPNEVDLSHFELLKVKQHRMTQRCMLIEVAEWR